jgi:transposase-like protein
VSEKCRKRQLAGSLLYVTSGLAGGGEPSSDEVVSLLPDGFWSLLRSWLRPHRGISQEKLPLYLGFFQFVHNTRRRGKALLGSLIEALVA